jgi:hypothetical protein
MGQNVAWLSLQQEKPDRTSWRRPGQVQSREGGAKELGGGRWSLQVKATVGLGWVRGKSLLEVTWNVRVWSPVDHNWLQPDRAGAQSGGGRVWSRGQQGNWK